MTHNRRLFLRQTGLLASAIAITGIKCASPSNGDPAEGADSTAKDTIASAAAEQVLGQFGLQLYTLRDELPKDPKGTLKQVSAFGYKQLEGFEDAKMGIYWGMSNKEFKSYIDGLGMTMISSHCAYEKNFEKKAAEASEIGMKYLLCPSLGKQKKLDDYKKAADKFNKAGDICKKNGIRFGYHNHGYSFEKVDGQFPQDIMMQNTNPETVDFEMDMYWTVTAGEDPITWLQKYPNRFRLCHVKDRQKNAKAGEEDASTELGAGSIDYKSILKVAKGSGMEYYIVEQEKYDNSTPIKSTEIDANYLKTLMF
ncbi:MAG TPA: sugar phosphate isomerase/epimerase [Flavitalea sp.]|nr:sugar phosphate isomerase/epimerase [Flavitalea sp.]